MNEPQHYVLNAETGYLELKLTQPEDRKEPQKEPTRDVEVAKESGDVSLFEI